MSRSLALHLRCSMLALVAARAPLDAADAPRHSTRAVRASSGKRTSSSTRSPRPSPGDPRYNGELPNFLSQEYDDQSARSTRSTSTRARAIGDRAGLTGQDRLSYDIFTLNRESALEELEFPDRLLPIDQFYNIANYVRAARFGHRARSRSSTVKDYDDWLQRAARMPVIFEQAIAQHARRHEGAASSQPRVLMEKVLPQLDANSSTIVEKSIFWGPVTQHAGGIFSAADRERLTGGVPQPHRHAAHARVPQAAHLHRR